MFSTYFEHKNSISAIFHVKCKNYASMVMMRKHYIQIIMQKSSWIKLPVPIDDVDDTVHVTGPTRTLLAVEDEDELVNSEDELAMDGSGGKLSSKSLPFPSHSK